MSQITPFPNQQDRTVIAFDRLEMKRVLDVYGRLVIQGAARDYAIGMYRDHAVFAIFRRHADQPSWCIKKTPRLARQQGAFSILGAQGQILKRGHELSQVLRLFEARRFKLIRS